MDTPPKQRVNKENVEPAPSTSQLNDVQDGERRMPESRQILMDGIVYLLEEIAPDDDPEPQEPLTDEPRLDVTIGTPGKKRPKWSDEEKCNLFLAANSRRHILRGSFLSSAGGKKQKEKTWLQVADYVSKTSKTIRTAEECKKKVSTFASDAKAKFNRLRMKMGQTGRGQLDDDDFLTPDEEMALDYVGEEAVTGVPGILPVPLRRTQPQNGEPKPMPWKPKRETRPRYWKIEAGRKSEKERDIEKKKAIQYLDLTHDDYDRALQPDEELQLQQMRQKRENEQGSGKAKGPGKGKGKGKGKVMRK